MKDAVKALVKNEQGKILVLFRSETHPSLAHDIDLPGGEVDVDETIEHALIREIYEETELVVSVSNLRREKSWQTEWGQRQTLYTAFIKGSGQVKISWEHEAYSWMTIEEFSEHQAIDEFMYRSQDWLKGETADVRNDLESSLVSQPAF